MQNQLFDLQSMTSPTLEQMQESFGFKLGSGWPDHFGQALRKWAGKNIKRPIRTLSLFTGAGGMDIGFHDAGFAIQSMIEIDERFTQTLLLNAEKGKRLNGCVSEILCADIRDFKPSKNYKVDFIIGGPPCQTFSAAGRRAAGVQGTNDQRGTLFEEYVRLLKQLRPKGFLFENVYGIIGAENGKAWEKIKGAFRSVGYEISHRILDAADYGVPQHRERLFIVGTKKGGFDFPRPTHGPDSFGDARFYFAKEAVTNVRLSKEDKDLKVRGRFGPLLEEIPNGLNYSYFTEYFGHPKPIFAWRSKFSDFLYKADPNMPVRTLKAQGGQYTGPFHWKNRPFSVNELKRLQTIPDDYDIAGGRLVAIHQIGNSVPPQLARVLALSILNQVFNVELPFDFPTLDNNQTLGFRKRKRQLNIVYKEKAQEAISQLKKPKNNTLINKREYRADLSDEFDLKTSKDRSGNIHVSCKFNKPKWDIRLATDRDVDRHDFTIRVRPTKTTGWGLSAKEVFLKGETLNQEYFTAAWKAFETELIRCGIKADLVQLCGYYQYQPAITCEFDYSNGVRNTQKKWKVVKKIVEGHGVRNIWEEKELAAELEIDIKQLKKIMQNLKSMGYEVRNHNTNPQIPKNHYLIPYSFPTLTSMSVQLRKSLEVQSV